jgi:hypothetical protein
MKILRGTIFGGIFYFFLGWLIYGILMMDFYLANTNQCANRAQGDMVWWAMIVSTLLVSLFLTLILNWSNAAKITDGLITGAIFGSLFSAVNGFSFWSMTTMYNSFLPMLIDIVFSAIVFGLTGIVIVLTWGKNKTASS